jgi:hypothetical protein
MNLPYQVSRATVMRAARWRGPRRVPPEPGADPASGLPPWQPPLSPPAGKTTCASPGSTRGAAVSLGCVGGLSRSCAIPRGRGGWPRRGTAAGRWRESGVCGNCVRSETPGRSRVSSGSGMVAGESPGLRWGGLLLWNLDGELLSTLPPPPGKDLAAVRRGHPGEKTVGSLAPDPAGIVRSLLHGESSSEVSASGG